MGKSKATENAQKAWRARRTAGIAVKRSDAQPRGTRAGGRPVGDDGDGDQIAARPLWVPERNKSLLGIDDEFPDQAQAPITPQAGALELPKTGPFKRLRTALAVRKGVRVMGQEMTPKHNESGNATVQAGGIGGVVALGLTLWKPDLAEIWIPLGAIVTALYGYWLKSRNATKG